MKRLRNVAVVGMLLAIVSAPFAYAAGLWFGLPVVGGTSYCAGTSTAGVPGTTAVCNVTAPAGPTTLTGNELVPADLNPQGTFNPSGASPVPGTNVSASPQSALIPEAMVASGAYLLTTPAAGLVNATVIVPNGINNVVSILTGSMTTFAYILPLNPLDGQLVRLTANSTVTTAFVTTGVGSTATVDTPTKIVGFLPQGAIVSTSVIGNSYSYLYNLSGNKWYRVQ